MYGDSNLEFRGERRPKKVALLVERSAKDQKK